MVLLEMECAEPWWLMVPHALLFISSSYAPECFCLSWLIYPFDSPSPKRRCYSVQRRTQASRTREERRGEKGEGISGTLTGPENPTAGEFFLEYLNHKSAKRLILSPWFSIEQRYITGFLTRKWSYLIGLILRINHSFKKSKYFFYGN